MGNSFAFEADAQDIAGFDLAIKDALIHPLIATTNMFLFGDVGAGKTFLCRRIISILAGSEQVVRSPTFPLLIEYDVTDSKSHARYHIHHYDLYRLKDVQSIAEIGIYHDICDKDVLCLIEWPDLIVPGSVPFCRVNIEKKNSSCDVRVYKCDVFGV